MLSLKGTITTIDALNCQRAIAQQIVDQDGDYVLALKSNQGTLHDDVRTYLDDSASKAAAAKPQVEADHGRIETRAATVCADIDWLQQDHQWPGLTAVGKVVRIRETLATTTTETAYYLLSQALSAERLNEVVRSHWGVENRLTKIRTGPDWEAARTIWRSFDTWHSTFAEGQNERIIAWQISSQSDGTMPSSPALWHYSEM